MLTVSWLEGNDSQRFLSCSFIIYEIFSELKPFSGSPTACEKTEHGYCYFLLFQMPENWTDGMNSINASKLSRNGKFDWRGGFFGSLVKMCKWNALKMNLWHKIKIRSELFNKWLIWLTRWIVLVLSSIIIIGVKLAGNSKNSMVWQLFKRKKTIAFSAGDILQSYSLQPFHSGPYAFLHLAVCFPKTMKVTAAVKNDHLKLVN